MRRFRAIAVAAAMLAAVSPATAAPSALEVLGVVTNAARPVGNALVIALNLQDLATSQTWSGTDGTFTLPALRSGIYKIIAVKQGFAPAITTIVPTRPTHRLTLRLESEGRAVRSGSSQEMWELRASLPPDILRQVESVLEPFEPVYEMAPRFRAEMVSMTGVANDTAGTAFASTELGVEGRIGADWEVGVRGDLQRFEDPTDRVAFGAPIAESSGMSMELRGPGDGQSYRVASTKSSWLYAGPAVGNEQQIDVSAHNFEWHRGPATLQVRYFQQANLFRDLPLESNLIEISGNVPLLQTRRNGLDMALRVTQETVEASDAPFRRADVSANGTFVLVPSLVMHYGMASRLGLEGQEWSPRAGAEWKVGKKTSLVGSASVKVLDRDPATVALPSIVFWSEDARVLPRYAYSIGFVSEGSGGSRFSAIASIAEIDEALRMVFADAGNQFWDGLLVDAGDIRRDIRIAWRREFGNVLAVDVETSAGSASQAAPATERAKIYVAGDLQSTFRPTGTTLAVSYRDIQQPREGIDQDYRAERLHLRMAQSLYLPIDIKLLLGLELARAENSPYLIDAVETEGHSKKYIGGLAVNF